MRDVGALAERPRDQGGTHIPPPRVQVERMRVRNSSVVEYTTTTELPLALLLKQRPMFPTTGQAVICHRLFLLLMHENAWREMVSGFVRS